MGFTAYNRGKRGLVIDLKTDEGRALFLDLARGADVVLDNYRLGVRDRLGIGHDAVTAANRAWCPARSPPTATTARKPGAPASTPCCRRAAA